MALLARFSHREIRLPALQLSGNWWGKWLEEIHIIARPWQPHQREQFSTQMRTRSLWFLDSHSFSPVIFHPFSSRISRIQRTLRMTHVDCSGAPYRPQGKNGAFYVERSIRIKNHQPESDLNERLSEWLCDWLNDWLARVRPSEPFDCLIDARSYWLIDAFVDLWLLKCLPNTFFLTGYFELLSSFEGVMVTFYVLRLKSFS